MVQIKWTKRALNDLWKIYEFIANDSPRYAQIQVEKIQTAVSNLAVFPSLGRQVPEFPHLPYREVLVGNYRVIYREEEKRRQVLIMPIVHGRQLLKERPNYH
ncbi:MAG: type II toxin-antitoxin system RelE/ParE family toxin [Euryarchaeota archaeon]|nr:type II toxin-antitoxin system RelE/ParE family toxin [Euryarchaeota archaeon]